jgi:hypothetical protein
MADDQTPLDDELDPSEDTPDSEDEDTAAADTPDPRDPEERLKDAQRKITQISQENARLRASDPVEAEPDEPTDEFSAKFESESWALAEAVYGPEAVEAYRAAERLGPPQTPADWVGTFEAYYNARSGKVPAPAGTLKADALEPKETGLADLGPDLQKADKKLTEARKGSNLGDFAAAAAARMGFGPS